MSRRRCIARREHDEYIKQKSWELAIGDSMKEFTFERFNTLLHGLKLVPTSTQKASWIPVSALEAQYREPCAAYSLQFAQFSRMSICLDDDVQGTMSFQIREDGEAAASCIVRKDGWCVVFEVVSDIATGVASWISLQESGGEVMNKFIQNYPFKRGEVLSHDRYYTSANSCRGLAEKNVESLGPLKEQATKQHPFDVFNLKNWQAPSPPPMDQSRLSRGIVGVESFLGMCPKICIKRVEKWCVRV